MGIKFLLKFFVLGAMCLIVGFVCYQVGVLEGEENILQTPPAYVINQQNNEDEAPSVDFGVFWEAWRYLETKFLDKAQIDYEQMVYGAAKGMIASLGDPYTSFFDPEEAESFEEELLGKYEGVGMYVGIKDGGLTVISPLKDSPAEQAGLKPEDKIVQINGAYAVDLTVEEAVKSIKGERGTVVSLLIQRQGWKEPKEFIIERKLIKIPTLEWEIIENNTALIKIYQFNQILVSEFGKAVLSILNSPVDQLIIDLRNNPGGYLEVAQAVAGWFLEKGEVVVWQEVIDGKKQSYLSDGPATFANYPIVVLINSGSASGAEILAGALRDIRGAQLIGEQSFGKGSVQEQVFLSDGSSMKITIAKWLTPSGGSIDQEGLAPDIEIKGELLEDEEDLQVKKALEVLQGLE